ncbi:MAG: putative bifunctional diguanylate cyclase/phosphodiesterase [Acidimicrobiales bacterium]
MVDGAPAHIAARRSAKDLPANLLHLPLSDRRFQVNMAMVAAVLLVHLGAGLAQDRGVLLVPGFVWTLLLLVPVVYGGTVFGLVGSLAAAICAFVVLVPEELLTSHDTMELWGGWSILALVLVIAVLTGARFEEERRLREHLVLAERERVVSYSGDHPLSFKHLFDALPYGVVLSDSAGVIRSVNGHLEALSGYRDDDLVGCAVEVLVPTRLSHRHVRERGAFADAPIARPHGVRSDLVLLRRDGTELPVDIALSPLAMAGEPWVVAMIRDDTARVAAEQARHEAIEALAKSEQRFRLAFENNMVGMVFVDSKDTILAANDSFCQMIGYSREEILGRDSAPFTHPEDKDLSSQMHRRLTTGEAARVNYVKRYLHSDGRVIFVEVSKSPARDETGAVSYFVVSVKDVTEERALSAQLSHQALHDPLTGLANRTLFEDRLSKLHERTARKGGTSAVMLLDLDDFKAVNDTLGHHVGDQLLVELAHRLKAVTRGSDTLCRLGGDEFLYLAEELHSPAEVQAVARRLLGVFVEPFLLSGARLELRGSLGAVVSDGADKDWSELLRSADTALYEAKRQDNDRLAIFTPDMAERASTGFELLQDLRRALPLGELAMHYQPLVDLATNNVVGFEALMRWHHPERGWVPPTVFIALAEKSELIFDLGSFALREAATAAAAWHGAYGTASQPYVSVNLSARQFHDPKLLSTVRGVLAATGLPPKRLVLEITESVALVDVATTTRVIEVLADLGVAIALDDFGTGYSSLSYLTMLAPSVIKIDRSFVSPAQMSPPGELLLETIVSLGKKLDMTVLAEGIETPEQLERLRHLGCDLGQGYFFSPAVPAGEVAALLALDPGEWDS